MSKRRPRPRRAAAEWKREVAGWKRSGLSVREYAESRGLCASTLSWWRSRLKKGRTGSRAKEPTAVELVALEVRDDADVEGRADRQRDEGPQWELTSASGHMLRVHGSLTVEQTQVIVSALTDDSGS